jgi:hypothetical protein
MRRWALSSLLAQGRPGFLRLLRVPPWVLLSPLAPPLPLHLWCRLVRSSPLLLPRVRVSPGFLWWLVARWSLVLFPQVPAWLRRLLLLVFRTRLSPGLLLRALPQPQPRRFWAFKTQPSQR